ncbi:hypothetical protein LTR36_006452 [Oleoguttula mirabilis]|uniref:SMP-30/Gluconolactonase/LRE-like region domain-containing protein n=1 Tax=Oleoguttula mirabilis TaxID=1507867 RepID=A0AAV9JWK0_9PEZI|nr:hypothetical protein LTR36_006452 [Oleoguttula mirabilis]
MRPNHVFGLVCILSPYPGLGTAAFPSAHTSRDAVIQTVYEFYSETWVENLANRANGNILTTIIGRPEVWEVNPFHHTAELLYTFPRATSTLGIAEVAPDKFAVAVGNLSATTIVGTLGSWSVWTLDLSHTRSYPPHPHMDAVHVAQPADAVKIADIPDAVFLNGMTTLPTAPHTILVGDAALGVVYSVNVLTGEHSIAMDNPAFKPNPSAPFTLGLNGIQMHSGDDHLYFTNSFRSPVLARIPLHANGTAAGPVETILSVTPFPTHLGAQGDDFALDAAGNAWITGDPSNNVARVTTSGEATQVVGGVNSTAIVGPTAAHFGRTERDRKILYVVTNGGMANPPLSGVVGGKVIALDTTDL